MTLALVEAGGTIVRLSDELETLESTDLGGTFSGSFSAHPKADPHRGTSSRSVCEQHAKRRSQLVNKKLRLFPRRKMPTPITFTPVANVGVALFGPAS